MRWSRGWHFYDQLFECDQHCALLFLIFDNLRLKRASTTHRFDEPSPDEMRYFIYFPFAVERAKISGSSCDDQRVSFTFSVSQQRFHKRINIRGFQQKSAEAEMENFFSRNSIQLGTLFLWLVLLLNAKRDLIRAAFLISVAIFADIQMKVNLMVKWKWHEWTRKMFLLSPSASFSPEQVTSAMLQSRNGRKKKKKIHERISKM